MINERTLIDNSSEALSMKTTLHECITREGINEIRIATGYWDVPGMALFYDEMKSFLEKEGTVLKLLIGKDPYVYANPKFTVLRNVPYKHCEAGMTGWLVQNVLKDSPIHSYTIVGSGGNMYGIGVEIPQHAGTYDEFCKKMAVSEDKTIKKITEIIKG